MKRDIPERASSLPPSWLGNPYRLGVAEVQEVLITGGGVLGTVSVQAHG